MEGVAVGWKTFNDRLALGRLGLVGAMLFFLAVKEPGLRDKILTLLGLWGGSVDRTNNFQFGF